MFLACSGLPQRPAVLWLSRMGCAPSFQAENQSTERLCCFWPACFLFSDCCMWKDALIISAVAIVTISVSLSECSCSTSAGSTITQCTLRVCGTLACTLLVLWQPAGSVWRAQTGEEVLSWEDPGACCAVWSPVGSSIFLPDLTLMTLPAGGSSAEIIQRPYRGPQCFKTGRQGLGW